MLAAVEEFNSNRQTQPRYVYTTKSGYHYIGTHLAGSANTCHEDVAASSDNSKL